MVTHQQCLTRSTWSWVQLRIQKEFGPIVFWCIPERTFPCCTNKEWELGQFIQCRVLPHSSKTTLELLWHNGLNTFLKVNSCFYTPAISRDIFLIFPDITSLNLFKWKKTRENAVVLKNKSVTLENISPRCYLTKECTFLVSISKMWK